MHVWRAAEAPPPTRIADELRAVNVLNQVSARLMRNEKYNHIFTSQERNQNSEEKNLQKVGKSEEKKPLNFSTWTAAICPLQDGKVGAMVHR
jgi:hypothetical protein